MSPPTGRLEPAPSTVTLPAEAPPGVRSLLQFFVVRFPRVPAETWRRRFAEGKVFTSAGPVAADAPFQPRLQLHYRREVDREPPVRTDWRVVHSDPHLLVADKPPFLPVTPAGAYVRHCLLHLMVEATGNRDLAPLHRIDKDTSGLVLLSTQRCSRGHYGELFQAGARRLEKEYLAVCEVAAARTVPTSLSGHVARDPERWWRQTVLPGRPDNAALELDLAGRHGDTVLLRVRPRGGRKHQIRVLLAAAGLPVAGDRIYGSRPRHEPEVLAPPMLLDCHRLVVKEFPAYAGGEPLSAAWESSRSFASLLAEGGLEIGVGET